MCRVAEAGGMHRLPQPRRVMERTQQQPLVWYARPMAGLSPVFSRRHTDSAHEGLPLSGALRTSLGAFRKACLKAARASGSLLQSSFAISDSPGFAERSELQALASAEGQSGGAAFLWRTQFGDILIEVRGGVVVLNVAR